MSRRVENDELKTMINSFRCSDLVSLLGSVGRNRSGRKNELQARAVEILKNPTSDISLESFKRKIRELYKAAQDEAKQTHNLELQQQQQMMSHNMPGGRMQHVLAQHANSMQQQRPMNNMNPYGNMSAQQYHPNQRGNLGATSTTVYQSGIGGLANNAYPGSGIYNHGNQQPIAPAPAVPICNSGKNVYIITPPFSNLANNVRFRKLPFYNIKYEILKPTVLAPNNHITLTNTLRTSANQEFHFSFVLSCDMASDMAMNRDLSNGKNEYNLQAQLRITAYDNVTPTVSEYDDFLPLGLVVRLNQRQCTLPMCSPNTRAGAESRRIPRPINITPLIKMSPINLNHLIVNWASEAGKTYVLTVNLVEKLSSQYLINKLKERPTISVDVTKKTIRAQYKRVIDDDDDDETNADDDDIATTIVRVSLVCPLAKFRMAHPAKGKNCSHLQCFDGAAYISLNEKKPMWMCPVCNRTLYFDDLLIDQYFLDVLQNDQLSEDCQEVQLLVDGTWKSYDEDASNNDDKQRSGSTSSPGVPSPGASRTEAISGDSIEMVANDDDVDKKEGTATDLHSDVNTAAGGPVVDLTEEEEETFESPMDVAVAPDNAGSSCERKDAPKTATPPLSTPPLPVNHSIETNNENTTENTSKAASSNNEDANLASTAPTSTDAASTGVSSSGYVSPQIISLMDSPSPPSTTPSSPPNTLAALNIGDS